MICERGKNRGGVTELNFDYFNKQGANFEIIEPKGYSTDYRFFVTVPSIYPLKVNYSNICTVINLKAILKYFGDRSSFEISKG